MEAGSQKGAAKSHPAGLKAQGGAGTSCVTFSEFLNLSETCVLPVRLVTGGDPVCCYGKAL